MARVVLIPLLYGVPPFCSKASAGAAVAAAAATACFVLRTLFTVGRLSIASFECAQSPAIKSRMTEPARGRGECGGTALKSE